MTRPEPSDQHEEDLRDEVTGLGDRRRLDRDLPDALRRAQASARAVGILKVDVDHFVTYVGEHGDDAGDEVLRLVAEILRANVREGDVVYRFGAEEFCILLPDTTDSEGRAVSERLRAAVERAPLPGEERLPAGRLTISLGLLLTDRTDPGEAMRTAEGALREARDTGRNRVVVILDPDDPTLLLS